MAGPAAGRDWVRWACLDGQPVLPCGVVQLACTRADGFVAGDHTIVTGRVDVAVSNSGAPLLHYRSEFHKVAVSPAEK